MTFNTRPTRSLGLSAMLALAATNNTLPIFTATTPRRSAPTAKDTEEQMRRELADCQAHKARLAAAKAKRERKNAKRVADSQKVGADETAHEGHNDGGKPQTTAATEP